MPTVIDSLVVKLGLDKSEFDKGKESVTSSLKDITKLLALVGGSAALKMFVQDMIESSSALERFSQNIQISVGDLSAWGQATEQAGGHAEGLQGSLDMLSKAQTQLMLTGESSLLPYFSALGVAIGDASGKARPATEILLDLSDRFSKMDRTTAFNMGRSMGIDPGTMNLLLKGRAEVEKMIARQKETTAVTKEQAEQSEKLREKTSLMKQEFTALGRELLADSLPALEGLLKIFTAIAQWARENKEFVGAFLTIIATGLAAISIASLPLTGTALLIVGLSAAIAGLWQDYQVWKRGGQSLINWGNWEKEINAAKDGIDRLTFLMKDLAASIIAIPDLVIALKRGDWAGAADAGKRILAGKGYMTGAYSPPVASGVSAPASGIGLDKQDQALKYFMSQGWTREQAAGIVANMSRESGGNERAEGDSGKAYGAFQWHPDRQANFKELYGKDIRNSTFEEQLAFKHYELTRGNEKAAGNMLRQATTPEGAGSIVSQYDLRPKDRYGEMAARGALAARMFAGQAGAGSMASSHAPLAAGGAGGVSVVNNIAEVNVNTQAMDADGIARDMKRAMDYRLTAQAESGAY